MRGLQQALRSANSELGNYAAKSYQAKLGIEDTGVEREVRAAATRAEAFAQKTYEAILSADPSEAQRNTASAERLAMQYAAKTYEATLGADGARASREVEQAAREAASFARQSYEAVLKADPSDVRRGVGTAEQLASRYAHQTYEATIGVRGAVKTVGELKAVDDAADRVDGRNVNVDVDASGLQRVSAGFKGLASSIKATRTVLTAAAIPFAIAAIGGAVPAVAAASASLAGLALNLGKAATGFGLVAGAAGGGAAAGLLAYGRGIAYVVTQAAQLRANLLTARAAVVSANSAVKSARDAVNSAKPGTQEYANAQLQLASATEQLAQAQREYRRQQILNTPAARDFGKQIQSTVMRLTRLEAAVGSRVLPFFTRELRSWGFILRDLTPYIADTAGDIAGIAAGFSKWFRTADNGKVLRDIVAFISESATKGAATLAALGQTGIMAFRPLIPLASRFQSTLLGVVRQVDRWVSSTEGQRRLGSIYRSLWSDANRLWGILKDLGRAGFNFFEAIDESGIADQATHGLSIIANGLARITAKGSEGRHALNAFLNDAKQLMPFVGGAALELASQIGRVISKVIDFREKGHRLTTLQEIFRGIKRSAGPMADLLIGTFKDLAPEIAKLIPRLVEFLGTFAGSSGPLVQFTKTLNFGLKIFNDLPEPVKHTIANLAAAKVILSSFGGDKIIGGLINLVGTYDELVAITSRLNRVLRRTPPTVETVPATGPTAKRLWAGRLASLAAGLALITIAVTFDYKGAKEKTKEAIKRARSDGKVTADEYGDSLADGLVKGLQGVPLLGSVVTFLDNNIFKPGDKALGKWNPLDYWLRRIDPNQRVPKMGFLGRTLMETLIHGMKAMPVVGGFLTQIDSMISAGKAKAKDSEGVGQTLAGRVIDGLKGIPIIGPFMGILDALFGRSKKKVKGQNWTPLGKGAAGDILKGFLGGGLIGGAVGLIASWFSKSKRKRDSQRWKPLGSSAVSEVLKGFATGGLVGGAERVIGLWFGRSKRKREGQRWKPLGSGAAADLLKGFVTGGLIGGTLALIEHWFGRSKRKREGQRWKPLGASAAGDVLKGFATGGLIGGALALLDRWFGRSKRKRDSQRWKPIGGSAAADILGGFVSGGLIGGAIKLIASWFSRSKNKADEHRWKPIGGGAAEDILLGFSTGGLIGGALALIERWFSRAKDKQSSQDWRGIGIGAAAKVVLGFTTGGVVGTVVDVLSRAAQKGKDQTPKFKESGKDSAWGYVHGFSSVDIAKWLVNKVKDGWDAVQKWGRGHSPWRRTMAMGIDAIKGWGLGLLQDGGLAERNAKKMAGRVLGALRSGLGNLGELGQYLWDQLMKGGETGSRRTRTTRNYAYREPAQTPSSAAQRNSTRQQQEARNAFRLSPITYQGRRPVGQWDAGDPRDMVSTILNSKAATIGKSWAKYLVYHLNRLPDNFRTRRQDDIQRLAPRLRQLGYSGFEDGTFARNQQMRRFQRGQQQRGPQPPPAPARTPRVVTSPFRPTAEGTERHLDRLMALVEPTVKAGNREKLDQLRREIALTQQQQGLVRQKSKATTDEKRLAVIQKQAAVASRLGNAGQVARLRQDADLTRRQEQLTAERKHADSREQRIAIMRQQAAVAAQVGNRQQVESLQKQIAQARHEQQRQAQGAHRGSGASRTGGGAGATPTPRSSTPAPRTEVHHQASAGHGITAREFRAALKQHTRDLAKLMRAGMADAPNLAAFQRQMDKSLGGYIGYRNGMGAQPQ